ncbi:hypothetical protein [Hymenobacter properus]|uniref:Uncharacterized protein n=1 Tax=Hymenobacter properus TaxID=2791026 RepID=A0A931FN45_9BACT|nr:hypothetical protein [Hymenobacter properus]MBF9143731.1 hypothetical protein [Hymenobacter properus]MBR7722544.1 hypothetical protein [Microvirga sp. SRT04]
MNQRLLFLLGAGFGLLLPGCVVYMPMQCAAPQITDKKQGELTLSTYLNGRAELAGTYSPVRHLLVRAAISNLRDNSNPKDTTYYRGHQYDLGVGTYWLLGHRWLVGGLGGFGQARSNAAFNRSGIIFPSTHYEYDARYNKVFGEVYGTFQASEAVSFGAAYRVTQVNFTSLTDLHGPVDLSSMTRSEPMIYFRVRLGDGPTEDRPVQLQAAWGSSTTFGYVENDSYITYPAGVRDLKQGRGYTTIGITLFPHCLFRKAQLPGAGR